MAGEPLVSRNPTATHHGRLASTTMLSSSKITLRWSLVGTALAVAAATGLLSTEATTTGHVRTVAAASILSAASPGDLGWG